MALLAAPTIALAETVAELNAAVHEIEAVKLGGAYRVAEGAYACADKGKLMFVERFAGGDSVDQSTAELIAGRDCESVDPEKVYTRCERGGFVFPYSGGRRLYSGYCVVGTTTPVLYIRDDEVQPVKR